MAPMTSMPSSPRLMRPLFSVMHSPRLTNRNGVETRSAPPITPMGTPHRPRSVAMRCPHRLLSPGAENLEPAVQRLAGQDEQEGHALQHQHRGVRQIEAALQHAPAGIDAAHQYGHGND